MQNSNDLGHLTRTAVGGRIERSAKETAHRADVAARSLERLAGDLRRDGETLLAALAEAVAARAAQFAQAMRQVRGEAVLAGVEQRLRAGPVPFSALAAAGGFAAARFLKAQTLDGEHARSWSG